MLKTILKVFEIKNPNSVKTKILNKPINKKNKAKPKKTKEEYPSMQDFYDDRAPSHIKQVSYLIVVNGFYLFIAIIFAQLYLNR